MAVFCVKCEKGWDGVMEFVNCAVCARWWHTNCAQVNKTIYSAISKSKNLSWTCDDCIGKESTLLGQLKIIKESIAINLAAIKHIEEVISSTIKTQNDNLSKDTGANLSTKRRLRERIPSAPISLLPVAHSDTTLHRSSKNVNGKESENMVGTTTSTKVVIGTGAPKSSLLVVEPRKWIFASRFSPVVTDDALREHLRIELGIEDAQICRLVPRTDGGFERNYVSFKINVPSSGVEKILSRDSWPPGVLVKEYLIYRNKNFLSERRQPIAIL